MLSMMLDISAAGICSANRMLNLIAEEGSVFDAHTGRSAKMKLETAGIDAGKEILAQPRNQDRQRSQTGYEEAHQESTPVMKTSSPTSCDSRHGSARRQPRSAAASNKGLRLRSRSFLRSGAAADTWPWSARSSATEGTTPAWQTPPPRPAAETDSALRRTAGTLEQRRCRSRASRRTRESRFASRCRERLRPCLCLAPPRGFD